MKLYYSQPRQRFEVAEYRKGFGLVLIDHDTNFDALGLRQGFLSDSDDEPNDDNFEPWVVVEDEQSEISLND